MMKELYGRTQQDLPVDGFIAFAEAESKLIVCVSSGWDNILSQLSATVNCLSGETRLLLGRRMSRLSRYCRIANACQSSFPPQVVLRFLLSHGYFHFLKVLLLLNRYNTALAVAKLVDLDVESVRLLIYTSQSNVVYMNFSERIDISRTSASLEKLRVNSSFFLNSLCHSADMCMRLGCSCTPDFPNLKRFLLGPFNASVYQLAMALRSARDVDMASVLLSSHMASKSEMISARSLVLSDSKFRCDVIASHGDGSIQAGAERVLVEHILLRGSMRSREPESVKHCKLNQISVSEHSALYEDKRLKYQKTFKLFRKWFDDAMVQSDVCIFGRKVSLRDVVYTHLKAHGSSAAEQVAGIYNVNIRQLNWMFATHFHSRADRAMTREYSERAKPSQHFQPYSELQEVGEEPP